MIQNHSLLFLPHCDIDPRHALRAPSLLSLPRIKNIAKRNKEKAASTTINFRYEVESCSILDAIAVSEDCTSRALCVTNACPSDGIFVGVSARLCHSFGRVELAGTDSPRMVPSFATARTNPFRETPAAMKLVSKPARTALPIEMHRPSKVCEAKNCHAATSVAPFQLA